MAESENTMALSHKLYDRLKYIAQVVLPALGTLWFTIGSIWNLAHTVEVIGTLTAIDTFLGVLLHLSSKSYYGNEQNFDGTMVVQDTPEKTNFSLELNTDVEDLPGKHSVEFRVDKQDPSK